MPELLSLQTAIANALADRARDTDALQLIADSEEQARARLAIYRGNIAANAERTLAAIYPIVAKLVGGEFFAALANAYCAAHPSASGDLNELGERLADFLRSFEPAAALPYLPEVAQLEWLAHRAHYAADCAALDVKELAALAETDFTRLSMTLHPAVAVVSSAYPLLRIWEVHQDDFRDEIAVDLASGAEDVVVYRPQFRVTVAKLSPAEAALLRAVTRGEMLGRALGAALNIDPQFDFGASLLKWTAANIVVALRIETKKS